MPCNNGNSSITCVFDNDPAIDYKGAWTQNTSNPGPEQQTNHFTSTNGSTISYIFNGTQITVEGIAPTGHGPLIASYSIDKGKPQTSSIATPSQNTSELFQSLFQSEILKMGKHTIDIDVLGTGGDRNYTFQQFKVAVPSNDTEKSANMTMSGNGSGNGNGGENDNGNGGEESNHGSTGQTISPSNTTAIVGSILGSVIFLILAFFGVYLFWRRRRLSRITHGGQNRLPPMMYYAQPIPDGASREQGPYMAGPGSYIYTDSKFTFPNHGELANGSERSWVSVNRPPSIPESAIMNDLPISDWSSYKGSSVINQQSHGEQSRFSPYTTATFSPMMFKEQTPPPAPRRAGRPPPLQIETLTRTSKSSFVHDGSAF